jgi:hypothetical protein
MKALLCESSQDGANKNGLIATYHISSTGAGAIASHVWGSVNENVL